MELIVGVTTVSWWPVVAGDMEDCSFVVVGYVSVPAVDAVVISWPEEEEEDCPLEVALVTTGGVVLALAVHFLSGELYVGDGALEELKLLGTPKNETKATVIFLRGEGWGGE